MTKKAELERIFVRIMRKRFGFINTNYLSSEPGKARAIITLVIRALKIAEYY